MNIRETIRNTMPLTVGEMVKIATEYETTVTDVVLIEEEILSGRSRDEILDLVMVEYEHNLEAAEIGASGGESILLGTIATQLQERGGPKFFDDPFLDDALFYTLAAQVGNHCVGLRPCAGTGDSCPYAGFIKAMMLHGYEREKIAEIGALLIKIGGFFRVGKVSTGCNMEGFGAGSPAIAAATVAMLGGTPEQMEKAMVIAISPTIAVPCTPRVLVPALCTTHVDGAILVGMFSAKLCMAVDMEVNVPFDVMLAMASDVHIESAKAVVPTVVTYMEPFFKRKQHVEDLIDENVRAQERDVMDDTLAMAVERTKGLARGTRSLIETFGEAVVGGSSQAVGSPTNAARIAHALAKGKIKRVEIELYPELFARRAINVPGVVMGAVFGASTADYQKYNEAVQQAVAMGIKIDVVKGSEAQIQKITIETDEMTVVVDTLNRGGGRVVLRNATPSLEDAKKAAEELGIVVVD